MADYTITITLPDSSYERVRNSAEALARPIEDILSQFITTAYPVLDDDLPQEMRSEFAGWLLFSDADLWKIARNQFPSIKQTELTALVEQQKSRTLTPIEQSRFDQLLLESQELMVRKAEAQRLLAQRGIRVYPKSNALS